MEAVMLDGELRPLTGQSNKLFGGIERRHPISLLMKKEGIAA